ncbi:MAG TPA: amidase [Xanthobacteraceae bacterium]|jgi:aspartyl-tRNA(Asn)/glutamyl-tRNA(Gln) amidotransferase subunit A|nr:amidase [Xanthobacteraceae bacterium]
MRTLAQSARDLASGTSSRSLVEDCLARILDAAGEGRRAFLKVHADQARAAADYIDALRRRGAAPSRFAGVPVSVKDLFDVAGDVTTAGSVALRDAPPAKRDAAAVARIRAAGFIPIGRTNMTEFAYSGVGLNPHYDTPRNPYDRATGRIPGGSSSGAAVSVADGMAVAALGTDTGGSCRIPAALCGIVGYKPTARRIPTDGVLPLSSTLDSVGPLAPTVACCAALDAVMAGEEPNDFPPHRLDGLRLAAPQAVVLDSMDEAVAGAYGNALSRLAKAGAKIVDLPFVEFNEIAALNRQGGFAAAEAYAWHRRLIETKGALYDPRVLVRIMRGKEQDAAHYIELIRARADLIGRVAAVSGHYDALIMPTVPIIAPPLASLDAEERFRAVNLLVLRNTVIANVLDRCAISIPCHGRGDAPVGLMLVGEHGADRRLFAIAAAVEQIVAPERDEAQ